MRISPAFWSGFRDGVPFVVIIIPFAMMFGVFASDAGLDLLQVFAMSVLVIAGASQFTAVALLKEHAPVLIVLVTALAVNLRMAMYSAALVPHLGKARLRTRALIAYLMVDQAFAVANKTYLQNPDMTMAEKVSYYFGCMTMVCPFWYAGTILGAVAGEAIPASYQLDFAVPICFIALVAPLMKDAPNRVAALVACVASLALAWLPWGLEIIAAALCGLYAGGQTELYLTRRAGAESAA